jgi:hypothetical protein
MSESLQDLVAVHEEALRAAEARRAEFDAARPVKRRQVESLKAQQLAEDERVGAGGERDAKLETRLAKEIRDLEKDMDRVSVEYPWPGGKVEIRMELVDPRAEAAWRGADQAVQEAERALRAFVSRYLNAIVAELVPRALEIQEEGTGVLQAAGRVVSAEQAFVGQLARLLRLADREALLGTMPPSPFNWIREAPRASTIPLPEVFLPEV